MRVVFIGTVEFSKTSLKKLIDMDVQVVGVCTREKSNLNADFSDLTPLCIKNKIPYRLIDDINSNDNINWIKSLAPDIIFCFGWSSLLKKELLSLPPNGVLGYHPAKLPQNRGRHPLIWSLVLGLEESASTFYFMDEGADSGDILSQKDFEITENDDARTLYDKISGLALAQIEEFVPKLINKTFNVIKQNHKISNTWRKRTKLDGEIDFRMKSEAIYNLVRALTRPYIGAHVNYKDKDIIIWKVRVIEYPNINIESGKVINSSIDSITVKTQDGAIEILEHEFNKIPKIGEYL